MAKTKSTVVQVTLPDYIFKAVKKLAKLEGLAVATFIRRMCIEEVEK